MKPISTRARLLAAAVLLITLPLFAAAVRGRPQGPYNYTLDVTAGYRGQSASARDKGSLTLTGLRIKGQNNSDTATFNLRFADRLNRNNNQLSTARGKVTADLGSYGTYTTRVNANTRVQKTRTGKWKLTATYAGRINSGPVKGLTLNGRLVAKSI